MPAIASLVDLKLAQKEGLSIYDTCPPQSGRDVGGCAMPARRSLLTAEALAQVVGGGGWRRRAPCSMLLGDGEG